MKKLIFLLGIWILGACQNSEKQTAADIKSMTDSHSFVDVKSALVHHLELDLKVDFASKIISGKASWQIHPNQKEKIVFDTRGLTIIKVTLNDDNRPATFELGKEREFLGKPLIVQIDGATTKVNIHYQTMEDAAALQWLNPQQTAGKKHPFLFTQSQAILARSWIPCQDSPGIRFTYNARVAVPSGLLALMSAKNPRAKKPDGLYTFEQTRPIPSYLMALAVGDISFRPIDERTGVYAEPVMIEKAAYELADMGKMTDSAEKIYGPYQWDRYDVMVLPPSFPFGGMENPMLTFATPTIIAGDRSLVSLIAHELAHSWSGNLVTNATWNDFWLNEGFTTYFERRIVEAVYGKGEAAMQEVLGYQNLTELISEMGPTNPDTRLKADFTGRDPDEGVSDIAYEKGYSFLRTIENAVGRAKFDAFLKAYFKENAFKSVTTEDFVKALEDQLIKADDSLRQKIDVMKWVYEPGLPDNSPPVSSANFNRIDTLISRWLTSNDVNTLKSEMNTNESLYFLSRLPDNIDARDMAELDKLFSFTRSGNAEIQAAWYALAIRKGYEFANPQIESFLIQVGRRKFLMPLYSEMIKSPEGKKWAQRIYVKARPNYHSVAYKSIDQMLR